MGKDLLNIDGLSVEFDTARGPIKALRNISFSVQRQRILGIVGESGSGKSTVLWAIMGLLAGNARVTSGEVRFDGENMLTMPESRKRAIRGEEISVVFQDPMTAQAPLMSYGRQMSDILYRRKMTTCTKREASRDMLNRVGIPDPATRIDQFPHQFSGGMRQRAGIAMSLLTGPKLLLADEPTTALDVTMEAQIIHLLQNLQSETGATIVVVSHNLGLIAELCDDVVVMYAGEVVETGPVRDIFHHARHPYTQALLDCDPARIPERAPRLPIIAGDLPDLSQPQRGCIFADRCAYVMPVCRDTEPPAVASDTGAVARCHLLTKTAEPRIPAATPAPTAAKPAPGDLLLEVEGLNVRFDIGGGPLSRLMGRPDIGLDAVLDASLSLKRGETLGLVGESGSGKTTLGRAILNLAPVRAGKIRFEGQEIQSLPERQFKPFRRNMAMMFQDPNGSLSPRKTVRALITEPLAIHGITGVDPDNEAERLADMVRLPRVLLSRFPHQLSGGQARRVGVARALALNPRLIVADEPTAGLDVSVQGEILNLMADLQAEHRLGYLIITHNLPVIRHIADRLAIMYLGRIVEQGRAEGIFDHQRHPYTASLVQGVPQPDPDRRRTHAALTGEVPSLLNRPKGCDFATRCPFVQPLCRAEKPGHQTDDTGRIFACHYPLS